MIDFGIIILGILLAIGILSGFLAVESGELMHAVFFLGILLVIIGELYILLGAEFLGVVQILVYAGGVTVLMLFTLLFIPKTRDRLERPLIRYPSLIIVLLLFSLILTSVGYVYPVIVEKSVNYSDISSILQAFSKIIIEKYLFLVGIAAIVIFMTMIASAYIASVRRD